CDLLSATGRKFLRGPRGSGFLYARQGKLEQLVPPFIDLHSAKWIGREVYEIRPDARRFENWENNYAAKIGLGVAVDYALALGMEPIWERLSSLAAHLRESLSNIPGVTVHDLGRVKGGIVTFAVEGHAAVAIKEQLQAQQINTSTTTVFSTRLDMEARQLPDLVRASLHYFNTEEEIGRFCEVLNGLM
ncbi:MAG: aminotransferase class V-fold PLP-dependent enzyme, partial [Anaerolineales bacterium]|nr:aminotransferase class V-fold PLP-dependent enzyme [Anaerolineales bacterium]